MGFLQRLSSVSAQGRMQASHGVDLNRAFLQGAYLPGEWTSSLSAAGVQVTPELALTLSAMYSGVTMIGRDLATLPLQTFKVRQDGGKDRVRGTAAAGGLGIAGLAYLLRWAPNAVQTATEFWVSMVVQWLLRSRAYAEIVPGRGGVGQLLTRHPDRVTPERLPSGRLRYRLIEADGTPRFLTQDEMFVIRDLSLDGGLTTLSRVQYGAQALGSAIATQRAAGKFFKSGMTAATVATYTGDMDPDQEDTLHKSISRYAAGVENSFGLMLIPDDVTISNLGVEPEKAQMMQAQEWGVREVARQLNIPGHKLGIQDKQPRANHVQGALEYVIGTLRPIAVAFEQAIQRDLILAKDTYLTEFRLEALLRGDFESQANFLEKLVKSRLMRPSEGRLILNMNPDSELDRLSEGDFRPGTSSGGGSSQARDGGAEAHQGPLEMNRQAITGIWAVRDKAVRCLQRERRQVAQLATKHANDPDGWKAVLREFYADHAGFIAQTMRMPIGAARTYAAQHGSEVEANGVGVLGGEAWQRYEADELAGLSLAGAPPARGPKTITFERTPEGELISASVVEDGAKRTIALDREDGAVVGAEIRHDEEQAST